MRVIAVLAAALLLPTVAAAPAAADASALTVLRGWVETIDASPDWSARYGRIAYDPANGSATLTGLSVRSSRPGVEIDVDTITVSGLRESDDGSLAARRVTVHEGAITAGIFRIALDDVVLDDFVLPPGTGFAWNPRRPFSSMVKAYGPLAAVEMARAQVGALRLVEELDGIVSRISYENIAVEGWADGTIERVSAGPLASDAPSPVPLIATTVASAVVRGIDLNALLHVYDPDNYAGGRGDRVWRSAVASVDYDRTAIELGGATLTIGTVSVGDVKVRQPEASFAAFFDEAMTNTGPRHGDDAAIRTLDLASAFSVGHFEMQRLDIAAIGFDRLHLDRLAIADLSSAGLGAFSIEGLEGGVAGQASLKIGRLALGDMVFPETAKIAAAIRTDRLGGDVDYSSLAPELGFLEVRDVDVDGDGVPPTRVGRLRLDLDDYVANTPTKLALDVTGADLATSMIVDDRVRRLLEGFGYRRVSVDARMRFAWNQADETTTLDDFRLAIADIGTLTGDAVFVGPTRAGFAAFDTPADALEVVSLKSGGFTFEDESLVGRALAEQAARLKVDPDKFREQFARGLPFMLTFLGNREFQREAAPVLQTFIRTPGSISVMMAPVAPIAVSTILSAVRTAPFSLPNLLALSISGEAGPEPNPLSVAPPEPVAADDAAMRRTLEPHPVE